MLGPPFVHHARMQLILVARRRQSSSFQPPSRRPHWRSSSLAYGVHAKRMSGPPHIAPFPIHPRQKLVNQQPLAFSPLLFAANLGYLILISHQQISSIGAV